MIDSRRDAETQRPPVPIDTVSGDVVDAALKIHRELGPGLLESVYERVLGAKLVARGYRVSRQHAVDLDYDGLHFPAAFRIDLLVADRLVVEIKSVERLTPAHMKQVLTYLRITGQPVGLLINFAGATLREGLHQIVNNHGSLRVSAPPREPNPSSFER